MSKKPTVSLVISVWNRKDDLRDNLNAIAAQTVQPDEVIVVDNCSKDGTPEMVRAEFPRVKLICMPHSAYGACETFNVGFASAGGEFVGIAGEQQVAVARRIVAAVGEAARVHEDERKRGEGEDRGRNAGAGLHGAGVASGSTAGSNIAAGSGGVLRLPRSMKNVA